MSVLGELGSLVGWERGRISPAIYFDPEVYRREHARIFEGSWVPVGHEEMVRNPGDYVANYLGEVPVIVARDRAGVIRVLINKCRHRGNQVCLFDRGNVRGFTCSYHGWSYALDGHLVLHRQVQHLAVRLFAVEIRLNDTLTGSNVEARPNYMLLDQYHISRRQDRRSRSCRLRSR